MIASFNEREFRARSPLLLGDGGCCSTRMRVPKGWIEAPHREQQECWAYFRSQSTQCWYTVSSAQFYSTNVTRSWFMLRIVYTRFWVGTRSEFIYVSFRTYGCTVWRRPRTSHLPFHYAPLGGTMCTCLLTRIRRDWTGMERRTFSSASVSVCPVNNVLAYAGQHYINISEQHCVNIVEEHCVNVAEEQCVSINEWWITLC